MSVAIVSHTFCLNTRENIHSSNGDSTLGLAFRIREETPPGPVESLMVCCKLRIVCVSFLCIVLCILIVWVINLIVLNRFHVYVFFCGCECVLLAVVSHSHHQVRQGHCGCLDHLLLMWLLLLLLMLLRLRLFLLLLRGTIDQRFLTTGNTAATEMMVMISGVVENGGAASGCRLVLLLILLMLTTTSSAGTTAATSTAPIPEIFPLTLGRRRLLLLRLLLAIAVTVRHRSSDAAVAIDASDTVILLLLLFAVDGRCCAAAVVVMMVCRAVSGTVGGRAATRRLDVHRLDVSVGFVRVARILRSSTTSGRNSFVR